MICVKLLVLLLFHAAFSKNSWHIYVDFELYKIYNTQYNNINVISVIKQALEAHISCPYISGEANRIKYPCATIRSVLPATYDELPDQIWTITCPSVLWIELNIIMLEVPIGGPHCKDGYVAFLNLSGEPPDVKYCGRRPQEELYASPKLTIIQHVHMLRSELRLILMYQYISRPPFTMNHRLPFIVSSYIICSSHYSCDEFHQEFLLRSIPYYMIYNSGIWKYHILCVPQSVLTQIITLTLHAGECNYVVYNGPGINSPIRAKSSTHGPKYIMTFDHTTFVKFWGPSGKCHNVSIAHSDWGPYYESSLYSDITLSEEYNKLILCSNESYRLQKGHAEFHVNSSDDYNIQCRINVAYLTSKWILSFDMEFHGPNIILQDKGNNSCQFGGINVIGYIIQNGFSFCESMVLKKDMLNMKYIRAIFIRFYAGYSSGNVKLRISTGVKLLPSSFNWDKSGCLKVCLSSDIHMWKVYAFTLSSNDSIQEITKHAFLDTLPNPYPHLLTEPLAVQHVYVHIKAGDILYSYLLGLIHFVFSLLCSGLSVCTTECTTSSGMLTQNITQDVYQYKGSVDIEKHVVYARFIALSINVSNFDGVFLKVMFEKVQHCNYNEPGQYAQQLNNHCGLIKVKHSLGYAQFLPQGGQTLVIGLNPECPVKQCIAMNVKLTSIITYEQVKYEWKNTALEHVPIKLRYPGYGIVSLTWTYSGTCPDNKHFIHKLCDVWIQLKHDIMYEKPLTVLNGNEYLTASVSANINQLYVHKM